MAIKKRSKNRSSRRNKSSRRNRRRLKNSIKRFTKKRSKSGYKTQRGGMEMAGMAVASQQPVVEEAGKAVETPTPSKITCPPNKVVLLSKGKLIANKIKITVNANGNVEYEGEDGNAVEQVGDLVWDRESGDVNDAICIVTDCSDVMQQVKVSPEGSEGEITEVAGADGDDAAEGERTELAGNEGAGVAEGGDAAEAVRPLVAGNDGDDAAEGERTEVAGNDGDGIQLTDMGSGATAGADAATDDVVDGGDGDATPPPSTTSLNSEVADADKVFAGGEKDRPVDAVGGGYQNGGERKSKRSISRKKRRKSKKKRRKSRRKR